MIKDEFEKIEDKMIEYMGTKDPVKAKEMQDTANKRRTKEKQSLDRMLIEYGQQKKNEKIIQTILVSLLVISIGVIIFLFTQSIFEGFVSLILFIFLVIYILGKIS